MLYFPHFFQFRQELEIVLASSRIYYDNQFFAHKISYFMVWQWYYYFIAFQQKLVYVCYDFDSKIILERKRKQDYNDIKLISYNQTNQ